MKYFAVTYDYKPENPVIAKARPAHREFIGGLKDKGQILGSGPLTDSKGGALIVLQFDDEDTAVSRVIEIMDQDPFYTAGAVTARSFREWNPVINSF
ncbi:YciI family protein [Corynebacterium sp.]|uniref:YciI family protein n=1 Tax=Corynebacterium sp. TaxID=1720 RepID=UPI0026DAD09B|nr:YciI family protein [Corynebacterium sp.]MDO5031664.1 YciI family protein [Corynebacterium sp.]